MLTHIGVASENAFTLPIVGITPKDSLLVRSVTGLSSSDIDLFIGDYSRDGGFYQGRRVGKRNVVLTIDLNPNPALGETIQGWRDFLYKAFNDPQVEGDYIRINLYDDLNRELYLVGYTEKFETDIFSSETTLQISVICPDPYIRSSEITHLSSTTGWIAVPFQYGGTAETGFEAEISVETDTSEINLLNNNHSMRITYPFTAGNTIYVNTIRGSRNIMMAPTATVDTYSAVDTLEEKWRQLYNDDETVPLIAGLSSSSRWIELHSQHNSMSVYGTVVNDGKAVIKQMSYRESFWGV